MNTRKNICKSSVDAFVTVFVYLLRNIWPFFLGGGVYLIGFAFASPVSSDVKVLES